MVPRAHDHRERSQPRLNDGRINPQIHQPVKEAQTFGGERGLGEVEDAESLAEATHLLDQVRHTCTQTVQMIFHSSDSEL